MILGRQQHFVYLSADLEKTIFCWSDLLVERPPEFVSFLIVHQREISLKCLTSSSKFLTKITRNMWSTLEMANGKHKRVWLAKSITDPLFLSLAKGVYLCDLPSVLEFHPRWRGCDSWGFQPFDISPDSRAPELLFVLISGTAGQRLA